MKKFAVFAAGLLAGTVLFAQAKRDPVADGYVDWLEVVDKNHLSGRLLCPSDLRNKFVMVVEVEGKDVAELRKQLIAAVPFLQRNYYMASHGAVAWERYELKRMPMVVVAVHGVKDPQIVQEALRSKDQTEARSLAMYRNGLIPVYARLTYDGAPDNAGKRPYAYLMGVTGTEPLAQGPADRATLGAFTAALRTAQAKLAADGWSWRPFTGSIEEPQFFPALKKMLETKKAKPLTGIMAKIKRSISSKKAEVAKEAQILYDALEQTRSDLVFRIRAEAAACPHRAAYDIQQLLKFWPTEKKRVADYAEKMKAVPEAGVLSRVFMQLMEWADPAFVPKNAGAAKKIVAELNKSKKLLEKLKESKNMMVQNGAAMLDAELDELISTIPSKVPEK
jgi:hypothetical protein